VDLIKINQTSDGTAIITLNRPEKRNALSIALMNEFCDAVENLGNDSRQRVILIKGEGSVFCAGLDLAEAQVLDKAEQSTHSLAKMLTVVHRCPCITIAVVHGAALAGGAGLMAACDFVIAEEKTLFGFPEIRRGLIAAQVMTLLIRQMRYKDLKELLLLGENIDAYRARDMGLVNRICKREELMKQALHYAAQISLGAPQATAKTKKLMDDLYPGSFEDNLAHALVSHHEGRQTEEALEGIAAYLEKREPKWVRAKINEKG
jgi:methylglutaconyl-CoA hydratase